MTMPTTPAGWPEAPAQGELFDNAGEPAVPALITHLANPEEEDDEPMPKPADNGEPMPKRHRRLTKELQLQLETWIAQPKYAKVTADQAARLFKTSPEGFYVTSDNIRHARRRAAQVEVKRLAAEEEAARQAEEAAEAQEREAVSKWARTETPTPSPADRYNLPGGLEAARGRIIDLSQAVEKLTAERDEAIKDRAEAALRIRALLATQESLVASKEQAYKTAEMYGKVADARREFIAKLRAWINAPEALG